VIPERTRTAPRPVPAGASPVAHRAPGAGAHGRPATTARTPRRRRRGRRALALLLIAAGVLLLADAVATLLWQEPLSSLYGHRRQAALEHRLAGLERAPAARAERRAAASVADPRRGLALAARAFERRVPTGQPLGRVRIPRIGLSAVVVQGTSAGQLRDGPGHYPGTPLPGDRGTVAIAGHRTTFGAWFRHIDRLKAADTINVDLPYGRFTYRVQMTRIVKPTALRITKSAGYDRLVLSACHPVFSASKRIVVFARLVRARVVR
jgi:sortase A